VAAKRMDDDGPVTGVQAFAEELRAQREAAGLTQAQLAKLMGYSDSVIAKLETCRTIPSPQHAAQADEALRMPGTFRRLRQAMLNRSYESWVRALLEMEDRATVLRWWEPLVVPGLLQTGGPRCGSGGAGAGDVPAWPLRQNLEVPRALILFCHGQSDTGQVNG